MPKMDLPQFKLALETAREREREKAKHTRTAEPSVRSQIFKNHAAIEHLIKPALTQAGVDVAHLDQRLAHNQAEVRRLFQIEKAEAAKAAALQRKAFHDGIDQEQKAIEYLANIPADAGLGLSSLVSLTKPFLIWEWPLDESLVSSEIIPLQSKIRLRLDVPAYSFDNASGSERREYSFYFFWRNESPFVAVVKCFSVLGLNGACELYANAGIFSGDRMSLSIDANLYPLALWLPLPPGGDLRSNRMQGDPAQHQNVLNNLTAEGGSLFGGAGSNSKTFSAASVGLSFGTFGGLQIPGNALAVFEVNLTLSCSWDGNSLPDEIIADFADRDMDYAVECPLVVLQFLTQPPVMA